MNIVKINLYWEYMVANGESADRPEAKPLPLTQPIQPVPITTGRLRPHHPQIDSRGMDTLLGIVSTPSGPGSRPASVPVSVPRSPTTTPTLPRPLPSYSGTFDRATVMECCRECASTGPERPNYLFYKPFLNPTRLPAAPYGTGKSLNAFYGAIHSVDGSNVVVAAGLAPTG